jgi:poly(3-hydroxybutyrate) depolymerase
MPYCLLVTVALILSGLFVACRKEKDPTGMSFNKSRILKDVQYGISRDTSGTLQPLTLDIYFPAVKVPDCKYPLFVMMHAGSFMIGSKDDLSDQCQMMADSGFIAVSVDYRLGWRADGGCDGTVLTLEEAEYRGMQDAAAALRYLSVKADDYGIDTSWIFVGGESAGAAIALDGSYISDAYIAARNPDLIVLNGGLNNSGNSYGNQYTVKGICDKFGALSDSMLIIASNAIPLITFHGTSDNLVPADEGFFLGCYQKPAYGSLCLYRRMEVAKGICEMYLKRGGSHIPPEYSGAACMSRTAAFFHAVMNRTASSKFFLE